MRAATTAPAMAASSSPPTAASRGKRIALGDRLPVMRQRLVDDGDLVDERRARHAGPASRQSAPPPPNNAADRCGRRGVGDAHFAQAQHVEAGLAAIMP